MLEVRGATGLPLGVVQAESELSADGQRLELCEQLPQLGLACSAASPPFPGGLHPASILSYCFASAAAGRSSQSLFVRHRKLFLWRAGQYQRRVQDPFVPQPSSVACSCLLRPPAAYVCSPSSSVVRLRCRLRNVQSSFRARRF